MATGLFGGSTNAGGSLFGGNQPATGGGSLFGGNNQKPAGQGIFNNQPNAGQAGNNQTQPTGGSLFGGQNAGQQAPATGGNLFGGQKTGAQTTTPLVIGGGQNNTTATAAAPVQSGGIFSGNQTAATTQNNLTTNANNTNAGVNTAANNTAPAANTTQLGAATAQNTQPQQLSNPAVSDVTLSNEKLNPLVQKWKRKIQSQSEHLLQTYTSLGESIGQIEQCYKYYDNIASISQGLNGQFEQINVEVKNIEQYQVQIEQHLDIVRSKLAKQLELQGDSEANAFKNPMGEKIQGIDYGLSQIENNVNQLIDEINPQKDQSQDGKKTIQQCLNSYYQILEKLEYDTINLQFKLQSVSEKLAEQP